MLESDEIDDQKVKVSRKLASQHGSFAFSFDLYKKKMFIYFKQSSKMKGRMR